MLCALTVRKLKPGTYEQFHDAFMAPFDTGNPPEGWVRFNMVRNANDPDEVIAFGIFDGTLEQLRRTAGDDSREEQMNAIAPFVESVGADGLYEVVEDLSAASTPAA
jgi:hypothetical protein